MRSPVILDTNLYISFLLTIEPTGVAVDLINAAFANRFQPAVPAEQLREMANAVRRKPYLRQRISDEFLTSFTKRLLEIAFIPEPLRGDIPRFFRDPRDDYLLAYAFRDGFDIIVSGDRDLLTERGRFAPLEILTPIEFRERITLSGEPYP